MQTPSPNDMIRDVGMAIGLVISLPILAKVWQAAAIVSSLQADVKSTNSDLAEAIAAIRTMLADHEQRLREQEGKMAVIWDGHERRRQR